MAGARATRHMTGGTLAGMTDLSVYAQWVDENERIHRRDPNESKTLCGDTLPAGSAVLDREDAMNLIAETGRSVCARCDRAYEAILESTNLIDRYRAKRLAPEQQAIRDRLDAEKARRAKERSVGRARQAANGSSVRSVSGGLPGLGKRKK